MSQIETSPGGVGFIRSLATVVVPGVPVGAKRLGWVVGSSGGSTSALTTKRRGSNRKPV